MLSWETLRRRRRAKWRTIGLSDVSAVITKRHRAVIWSTRSRLVGRVGTATILEARNILVKLVCAARVVTTGGRSVWHHGRVTREISGISSLADIRQSCSICVVRIVGKLSWSQRLVRIHARRAEELAVSGNVKVSIGSDWKLGTHGCNGGHVATSKRHSSKRVQQRVHGVIAGSRTLRE